MKVELRETTEAELDFVVALEAAPDTASFIEAWPPDRHRKALHDPDIAHLIVVDDDQPAGFTILAGLRDPDRSIELRRIVIAHPGQGLGRAALTLILDHAFTNLAAHRLWLDVKPTNARARHLYTSVGFIEEGILQDALRTPDGYEPLILMAKLASDEPGAASAANRGRNEGR